MGEMLQMKVLPGTDSQRGWMNERTTLAGSRMSPTVGEKVMQRMKVCLLSNDSGV